eukprot:scaffold2395_cov290-Prasinococcus_capsulatus_cf.AAC.1
MPLQSDAARRLPDPRDVPLLSAGWCAATTAEPASKSSAPSPTMPATPTSRGATTPAAAPTAAAKQGGLPAWVAFDRQVGRFSAYNICSALRFASRPHPGACVPELLPFSSVIAHRPDASVCKPARMHAGLPSRPFAITRRAGGTTPTQQCAGQLLLLGAARGGEGRDALGACDADGAAHVGCGATGCQVLRFSGFFKEAVVESNEETYRVRK